MTPVAEDAHARFHAREREYRYFIEPRKNPFTRHLTWQYYVPLDIGRMNEAAALLTQYDDFTSFAKLNSNNKTNICRVKEAVWTVNERGTMCFTIRADRFLRNMVRSLVGRCGARTLYACGVPGYRREPRLVAFECGSPGTGIVPERRMLSTGNFRTSLLY